MTPAGDRGRVDGFPAARARLSELLAARPPLLVVSDFDGTLAPIEADPMAARIDPIARGALRTLARIAERRPDRLALAVLSGRGALDVAGRVRVGGLRYLGGHGVEGGALARRERAERLAVHSDPALDRHLPTVATLARGVRDALGAPAWLFVEPKGPTLAFHFRQAPDPDAARVAILEALDRLEVASGATGLVRFEGRMVVELRPLGTGGKGAAVARLIDELRPGGVLVLGDDRSDAEAFDAAHAAAARPGGPVALAVGVHAGVEVPAEVVAAADIVVASPREASRLLAALARELGTAVDAEAGASG